MHEIITIQIGGQSNHLGTHFWNAQESYFTYDGQQDSPVTHDVSFRQGVGADGSDTYTPRLLVYDIKDAFGTLRQTNALYDYTQAENEPLQGLSNSSIIRQPAIESHPYQEHLESNSSPPPLTTSSIRYWSDYNRVFYHPRSLVQLYAETVTTAISPLNSWSAGSDLFEEEDKEHDVLDRDFRFFAEECDQMQGVQLVTGHDSAWGGFAAKYVERLRDELGKGVVSVWGLGDTIKADDQTREKRLLRLSNSIRSAHTLSSSASTYTPLTSISSSLPSYVSLDRTSAWHTSALQASLFESLTLPSRLNAGQPGRQSLSDIEQLFTAESAARRVLQAGLSIDNTAPIMNGATTNGVAHGASDDPRTRQAAPDASEQVAQADIMFLPDIEGQPARHLRDHLFSSIKLTRGPTAHIHEAAQSQQQRNPHDAEPLQVSSSLAFPFNLSSYPSIVTSAGEREPSIVASLSTTSTVATWLRSMADHSRRLLPLDEREDASSALRTMADEYIEGWESADEDDSGDSD